MWMKVCNMVTGYIDDLPKNLTHKGPEMRCFDFFLAVNLKQLLNSPRIAGDLKRHGVIVTLL